MQVQEVHSSPRSQGGYSASSGPRNFGRSAPYQGLRDMCARQHRITMQMRDMQSAEAVGVSGFRPPSADACRAAGWAAGTFTLLVSRCIKAGQHEP